MAEPRTAPGIERTCTGFGRRPSAGGEGQAAQPGKPGGRCGGACSPASKERGFTLVEMIFAVGILAFGLSALIGVMTVGVSTRRSAELKSRAALAADAVVQHLQEFVLADARFAAAPPGPPGKTGDVLPPVVLDQLPGWPGLSARVELTRADTDPDLLLAEVAIVWRERGEAVSERFFRILPREVPFARRISTRRSKP